MELIKSFTLVTDQKEIPNFQKDLARTVELVLDIESTGLDFLSDTILLVQVLVNNITYVFDFIQLDKKYLTYIIQLIQDSGKTVLGHNIKFDIKFLHTSTEVLLTNIYDTQVAEVLLTAGVGSFLPSLAEVSMIYLDIEMDKAIRKTFQGATEITQEQLVYAAEDVKYVSQIKEKQMETIHLLNLDKVLELEMKLLPVVAQMEINGVLLDREPWMTLHHKTVEEGTALRSDIVTNIVDGLAEPLALGALGNNAYDVAVSCRVPVVTKKLRLYLEEITVRQFILDDLESRLNIASYTQLKAVLWLLDIPVEKTNVIALSEYKDIEIVDKLLKWKKLNKRITSFGESFLRYIDEGTGRIHTNFNQVGTATGRFSSSNPNLQNIIKLEEYRNCFIARPGYSMLTTDYSQAELRLMGAVCNEKQIIEAYKNGEDIHAKTASIIFNKDINDVTEDERYRGKTINFSILYGSTAYGLSTKSNVPMKQAEGFLEKFFGGYPRIKAFIDIAGEEIWKRHLSATPLGRIRFFKKETVFQKPWQFKSYKSRIKREGINHVIQGGSADSLKLAMVEMFYNNPFGDKLRMLKQVHDEVVLEVHDSVLDEVVVFVQQCMVNGEQPFLGEIPAEVNYKVAPYWSK